MNVMTVARLHDRKCPLLHPVRVRVWTWVWLWLWVQVVMSVGQRVGMDQEVGLQTFPIAAEENLYSFNPDGTYTFSYDTGGGQHQSFRIETRDASGRVSGRFGYVDPSGSLHITQYQADSGGYRASVEVYHRVSLAPPAPLIVGPLPKPPTSTPDPPDATRPQPDLSPMVTVPFQPPSGPVLIIGPLPKPLQPRSSTPDQRDIDLKDDSLINVLSDQTIPNVLPLSPLGNVSPRGSSDVMGTLQGASTDTLQTSTEDNTFTDSPEVFTTDGGSLSGESEESGVGVVGQAESFSTTQQPSVSSHPQQSEENDSTLQSKGQSIKPTMTETEKVPESTPPVLQQTQTGNYHGSNSVLHEHSPNEQPLQPSTGTITITTATSTITRLTGRGTHRLAPTVTSTSLVLPTTQKDMQSESKAPLFPPPSLTYLPVGVGVRPPRNRYPTAPLLQLPRVFGTQPV